MGDARRHYLRIAATAIVVLLLAVSALRIRENTPAAPHVDTRYPQSRLAALPATDLLAVVRALPPEQRRATLQMTQAMLDTSPNLTSSLRQTLAGPLALVALAVDIEERADAADGALALGDAGAVRRLLTSSEDQLSTLNRGIESLSTALKSLQEVAAPLALMLRNQAAVLASYTQRASELEERVRSLRVAMDEQLGPRAATTLSVDAGSEPSPLGDPVLIRGVLSGSEGPLAARKVTLESVPPARRRDLGSAETDVDGAFVLRVPPFTDGPRLPLVVRYAPTVPDDGVYLGSSAQVDLVYDVAPLELQLDAPARAAPGRSALLRATLRSDGGRVDQPVTVQMSLGNASLGAFACSGTCDVVVQVPADAPFGFATWTAEVGATGRYLAQVVRRPVSVEPVATSVDVEPPSFAIVPGAIRVRGRVHSSDGLPQGKITVQGAGAEQVFDLRGESFDLTVSSVALLASSGAVGLRVGYAPAERWIAPAMAVTSVFVLSPVAPMLAMVLALIGWVALRSKRLAGLGVPRSVATPAAAAAEDSGMETTPAVLDGVRAAYWRAVRVLEPIVGQRHRSQWTLRDFLTRAVQATPQAAAPFQALTTLTEQVAYGGLQPDASREAEAGELADGVRAGAHF